MVARACPVRRRGGRQSAAPRHDPGHPRGRARRSGAAAGALGPPPSSARSWCGTRRALDAAGSVRCSPRRERHSWQPTEAGGRAVGRPRPATRRPAAPEPEPDRRGGCRGPRPGGRRRTGARAAGRAGKGGEEDKGGRAAQAGHSTPDHHSPAPARLRMAVARPPSLPPGTGGRGRRPCAAGAPEPRLLPQRAYARCGPAAG